MGMKKSIALMSMMALAMSAEGMDITERGSVASSKPKRPEPRKHAPFNKQERVLKMIEDYKLIRQGKSKKGIIKQSRIKNKVDEWLKSGMLDESDL